MSEYRIFIKRIALVATARFITSFRGIFLLPLLTKTIGATYYGIWTQILITLGLLTPFLILNLNSSTIRFLSAEKDHKKIAKGIFTVIFFVLGISIFFALFLFLFSGLFAKLLLQEPSAAFFIKLTAILLVLETLNQISLESFRVFGQIKKYSMLTILQTILEIGLIAGFIFSGFGLFGALMALLIIRIIILSFSLYSTVSYIGFALPDFSILKPYFAFALPLLPIGLSDILINSSDRYIIGFFNGSAAVGIYSATYSIGLLAVGFIFPIAYILSPTIFKLFEDKNLDKVKTYLSFSLKYFLLFSIPSVFGLTILSKTILVTLATHEFILFNNNTIIVLFVSLGMVFYGIQTIYGQIIMMNKNTNFFILAFGSGVIVNIILNIILVPYFGGIAAAFNTFIAYSIVALLMYTKSIKYITFKVDLFFISKSILASLLMSIVIYIINPVGLLEMLLTVIVGMLIYFIALVVFRAFPKEEVKVLLSAFKLNNFSEKY